MPRGHFFRPAVLVLALLLAALAFPGASLAIPISWNNAAGGNWNTAGNWSPAQVPTSADDVTIDLAGDYTVTINTNPTVASLALGAASGTQTLLAVSRTITVNGAFVVSANGSLDFSSCTLNGTGSLTHSGTSSRLFATTVSVPITNDSTLRVQRGGTWNGAYTSGAGSTLRVESELGTTSTLTVASGFTNNGTLELTTISNAGPANLTWSTGTLTNASGATMLLSAGTGGTRTLTGALSNSGTVTVNAASTLAGSGADHVNTSSGVIDLAGGNLTITQTGTTPSFTNNGTLTVPAGRTLTVTSGEFVHASPGLSGDGTFSISSVTLTQTADYVTDSLAIAATTSTLNGPGTFRNSTGVNTLLFSSCVVNSAIVNDGTLRVQRGGTWNGAYTSGSGSTLRVESELGTTSTLTVASGFTNNGTLELTTISNAGPANLTWSTGTLTNASGATMLLSAGTGGTRTLTGALSNSGTVTVNAASTLAGSGADHVNTSSGVIDLAGGNLTITQTGTTPSFTNNGTLTVPAGRTLTVTSGEFVHASPGLSGDGTFSISSVTLTQTADYVTDSLAIAATTSTLNGPGTFRNSTGVNTLLFSSCVVNSAIVNDGTLRVQRHGTWNGAYTSGSGSTLRVESEIGVQSTLTVASAFTNNGTLELTTISSSGISALTWSSGTLVNPSGATLLLSAGTGGARTLTGALSNAGTLTVNATSTLTGALSNAGTLTINAASTLAGAGADHVNTGSGVIDLAGGSLTINQAGTTPSFTNNGTLTVASGRTLAVTGGEFVHANAAFSGAGTFSISSVTLTQTVDYVTSALAIAATSSTLNGPGTFRNSTGVSTVFNGCVVNSPLVNDGTLRVQRSGGTWNGAYTSGSGSTLRVESESFVQATLTLASAFTNNGTLELTTISNNGNSALTWSSGALVNASGATILLSAGTGGARTLTGVLSNAGALTVNATSTLAGSGADHVNAASGLIDLAGGNLTITQTGTTPSFTNNGTVSIGATRTLTVSAGTLANTAGGTLRGNGTLNISGTTFTNGGNINPGTSAGSLTITGPCPVDSTGAVNIELGGANPGTGYDRLTVSGTLTLNAPVNITLINGFVPTPGQTFQILSFGSNVRATSPWITGLDLGNGISLYPQISATSITLKAVGQTWVRLLPVGAAPPARERHAAAYNPTSNRMIVFGGLSDAGPRNDVWVLSSADGQAGSPAWVQLSPTGGPPSAREGHSAVYDDGGNKLIVFGGDDAGGTPVANAEVWVLSGADGTAGTPTWTQLSPTGGPPSARTGHGAVYDSAGNRMIVFGGDDGPPCGTGLNDVWVLTNSNGSGGPPVWSQLSPSGTLPGPRAHALATYDAATNRMTMIGGLVPCGSSDDEMWVLADANGVGSPAWSQSSPSGSPPSPWSLQSGVYDPVTNRVTAFGGLVGGVPANLVRTVTDGNGSGSPVWVDLTPTSGPPDPRSLHSAVQANGHRMVAFGGAGASGRLNDVWVLEETQGRVVDVPPDPIPPPARSWDTGFTRPPSPNPGRSGTHFAIALSHAQRVELTIWDVAGRRVAVLQHGLLDAGEHAFDWGRSTDVGDRAPAGLYLLSLKTEELRQVRKFVLAR